MRRTARHLSAHLSAAALSAALSLSVACTPSPDELYEEARKASESKQFDQALTLFNQMAQADSLGVEGKYKSQFGVSEVHLAQGDLEAQARVLEGLMSDEALSAYRDALRVKLEENYLGRAKALGVGDSTRLTVLLTKAINLNAESAARTTLAEHYVALANIALSEGRYDDAEESLGRARELHTKDAALNAKIEEHSREARLRRFMKNAERLFEARREELARAGRYSEEARSFKLSVRVEVDGKITPKDFDARSAEAERAAEPLMGAAILGLVKELFDVPSEGAQGVTPPASVWTVSDKTLAKRQVKVKREGKSVAVTPFDYSATVSLEQLYRVAFEASAPAPAPADPAAQ